MIVELKRCKFDLMLVKPKCVWEVVDFLKNWEQTAEDCKQLFKNWKNLQPLKRILALSTWGQTCTVSFLLPFTFDNFQSELPVSLLWLLKVMANNLFLGKYIANFLALHLTQDDLKKIKVTKSCKLQNTRSFKKINSLYTKVCLCIF